MDDGIWHLDPKPTKVKRLNRMKSIRYEFDNKMTSAYEDVYKQIAGPRNLTKTGIMDIIPFRKVKKVSFFFEGQNINWSICHL